MKYSDEFGNFMGETILPELDSAISFHKARYEWAVNMMAENSKVLDIGCGIGYGSEILIKKCREYVGFDYLPERKMRADRDYKNKKTIFLTHNANDMFPFEDNVFDFAVCFEALEHIEKSEFALTEIKRVVKNGGQFFCSTPVKRGGQGHFHKREYSVTDFTTLMSRFFKCQFFGQNHNSTILENVVDGIYILCSGKVIK